MYNEHGLRPREIAQKVGLERSCVAKQLKKLRVNPDPYWKAPKPGRPRKLNEYDLRRARRAIITGQAPDASFLQRDMFPGVSARTVQRELCRMGLHGRRRRKKPLLTEKHKEKRRVWVAEHGDWTLEEWKKVWFEDESKFNLVGSDGCQYCRRGPGEEFLERNVDKRVKHGGGSVMVWGVISWTGPGRLHRVKGTMNADQYTQILSESLLGSLNDKDIAPEAIILAQDNNPKHKSRLAQNWFRENNIKLLPWPPSSPDMNLIEHAWEVLDRRVRARAVRPTNVDQLWVALQEEWERLDMDTVRALYESMPRRTEALRKANGSYTKY